MVYRELPLRFSPDLILFALSVSMRLPRMHSRAINTQMLTMDEGDEDAEYVTTGPYPSRD
jgi:hypothetical protein